jgi:Fe-S-cluster containining protein
MEYSLAVQKFIPFVLELYEKQKTEIEQNTTQFTQKYPNEAKSCKKGCGACCHFAMIPVTISEAFVLLNQLIVEGQNLKELSEQLFSYVAKYFKIANKIGNLPITEKDQKNFLAEALPCPFFRQEAPNQTMVGHCGVFEIQPSICIFYHSIDSPALCAQKKPHRTIEAVMQQGFNMQNELQNFERKILGRSALGHMPLLLAALCTTDGLNTFLQEKPLSAAELHQEYAQELHDFTFYAELLGAIGYTLTERDILALSQAQKEI